MLKRPLDTVLASALLVVSLPILLPACLAIWLETAGSPFFLQWRSGLAGRPFRIIKLRTMVNGADRLGPALTQAADPRITKVGSVLRRWSIDELPQLLNVIGGQMSLVGPRPELVTIVAGYTVQQQQVLRVRPGLTGWAQVNGRDDVSIPAKLELEIDYLGRCTMLLDLAILARTVGVVLSGRGTKRLTDAPGLADQGSDCRQPMKGPAARGRRTGSRRQRTGISHAFNRLRRGSLLCAIEKTPSVTQHAARLSFTRGQGTSPTVSDWGGKSHGGSGACLVHPQRSRIAHRTQLTRKARKARARRDSII